MYLSLSVCPDGNHPGWVGVNKLKKLKKQNKKHHQQQQKNISSFIRFPFLLDHRVKTKVGNVKKQTVKYAHGSCIGDVTPNSFLLLSLKKCLTHESDLSSYMGHKSWEPRKITKKKKKKKGLFICFL